MGAPGTDLTGWRWVRGRSGRLEYWLWTAILLLVSYRAAMALAPLVPLIVTILAIAVQVRRFHDIGVTGWWVVGLWLGQLVVYAVTAAVAGEDWALLIATFALLLAQAMLGLIPGQKVANRFGPPAGRRPVASDVFN